VVKLGLERATAQQKILSVQVNYPSGQKMPSSPQRHGRNYFNASNLSPVFYGIIGQIKLPCAPIFKRGITSALFRLEWWRKPGI
jgi:hypothetical protein